MKRLDVMVSIIVVGTGFCIRTWGGHRLAAAPLPQSCSGACTDVCNFVDGVTIGAQSSHACAYVPVTTLPDGSVTAAICGSGGPAAGWCRKDACNKCNGLSSSAGQAQNHDTCEINSPDVSLCTGTCSN